MNGPKGTVTSQRDRPVGVQLREVGAVTLRSVSWTLSGRGRWCPGKGRLPNAWPVAVREMEEKDRWYQVNKFCSKSFIASFTSVLYFIG